MPPVRRAGDPRIDSPQLAIPFATRSSGTSGRNSRSTAHGPTACATRRAFATTTLLPRGSHVAYEQLTGAAAKNYLRSVVVFVLDKGVDIDLSSLSTASELNMLHEASWPKACPAVALRALVRKAFGPSSSAPRSVIGACDVLDAREAAARHPSEKTRQRPPSPGPTRPRLTVVRKF